MMFWSVAGGREFVVTTVSRKNSRGDQARLRSWSVAFYAFRGAFKAAMPKQGKSGNRGGPYHCAKIEFSYDESSLIM